MAKYEHLGLNKTDTLAAELASGATSATLTNGNFGSPTGTQILIVDYDVPAKIEEIEVTITGTALTSITRTRAVDHSVGAKVLYTADTPTLWTQLRSIAALDSWTSYTPTFTNLTVGNGTLVASYFRSGRLIHFKIKLTFGSTTSVSGAIRYTLPVTGASDYINYYPLGTASAIDSGSGVANGKALFIDTTTGAIAYNADTGAGYTEWNATAPFTWTTSDVLMIEGSYESAS